MIFVFLHALCLLKDRVPCQAGNRKLKYMHAWVRGFRGGWGPECLSVAQNAWSPKCWQTSRVQSGLVDPIWVFLTLRILQSESHPRCFCWVSGVSVALSSWTLEMSGLAEIWRHPALSLRGQHFEGLMDQIGFLTGGPLVLVVPGTCEQRHLWFSPEAGGEMAVFSSTGAVKWWVAL